MPRLALALVVLSSAAAAQSVLVGESRAHALHAYLSGEDGLTVRGWKAAPGGTLRIGHGCEPRFDAAGNLYLTRSADDGYRVLTSETLVIDAGARLPRPLRKGEVAPVYRLPAPAPEAAAVKIVVDAGHGGTDSGAVGNGLKEKDVNLDIALRLKALLDLDTKDTRGGGEWNLLMTRSTDVFVSLRARTNAANAFAAKSFLSVHNNAATSSLANGTECYCYLGQSRNAGGLYRNRLHVEMIAAWKLRDRGVKEQNFHVLRESKMPAALLEGGFITSPVDAKKLGSAAERQRFALGLLWATQEHHGFKRYTPSGGVTNGNLRGVIYDASKGTTSRISGATVSLSSGVFQPSSATSGAFLFSLKPGAYRYAATAPGFEPAELVRTVVSGKDVWGSVGLRPANVPALRGPSSVTAGNAFTMTLAGDAGSPTFLMIGTRPLLPLFQWGAFGRLWPNPGTSIVVGLAPVPSGGVLSIRFTTSRTPGLRAHLQGLVRSRRAWRLSNGAAVQLR